MHYGEVKQIVVEDEEFEALLTMAKLLDWKIHERQYNHAKVYTLKKNGNDIDISFCITREGEFSEVVAEFSGIDYFDSCGKKYKYRKVVYRKVGERL